ncbi:hypothetical protein HNQ07_000694 [Deinococcus metalli]|uniref:Uncharacterized protein n=1 Tax=Deinococcus metalli TaxID=1141878 RepID=A0A7W8KBQ4_9DEIO|nr:hypothetical protein [Deinococcus metalli]MBB5375250.1 hypothetical protein [Deinococcus metalli]GHF30652.1 hypothetical protein GCM10017781_03470 [Deinococcus metalli]
MMPGLHLNLLPDAVAWIVHPAAGFALAHWASVLYSRLGKNPAFLLRAALILLVLSVLGAGWVLHPAAGMLLGYFGSRAFHRWRQDGTALLAGLLAAALFMVQGATWLIFPLGVMAVVWVFTALSTGAWPGRETTGPSAEPAALPEHAGGLPMMPTAPGRAEPVMPAAYVPPRRHASAAPDGTDPFTALQLDDRLPGDVRAQLVALDLRTAEALNHLKALGQEGSEGAYVARAIRDEYAPASVRAYLNLPRTQADVTPIEGDRTGHDLLREQLDLLLGAVQDILAGALRSGGQDLLTHQRFLREKFGKEKRELDV